jgi:hypothetical protein
MNPLVKDLIRKFGIDSDDVIKGLIVLVSKVDAGPPGTKEETTFCDATGIHNIKFEKLGAKTHTTVTRPAISNADQRALVRHFIQHQIMHPDEVQEMISAVRRIRKGEMKGALLMSLDGITPIVMRVTNDKLVFDVEPLMAPGDLS